MVYIDGYFKEILYLILRGKCAGIEVIIVIKLSSNNYDYSNRKL